jgi:hypothetical protein
MDDREAGGFTAAYRHDDTAFPVIVMAMAVVGFTIAAFVTGQAFWLIFGVAGAAATYYNIPLLETGRPAIGANQYGIFVQGLGLIRWRAIERVDLVPIADRAGTLREIHIALMTPLGSALVIDWQARPLHRMLMRLPWSMTSKNIIRVYLDPFDRPPEEIHQTLLRMWKYYRS